MGAQTLVEKAEEYLKNGQYTEAVELWNKVVKQFPNTPHSAYSESQIQRYGNLSETLYEIPIGPFTWRALDKKDINRIGYVVYILVAFFGGIALEEATGIKGAYIAVILAPIFFVPFYGKISNWPKGELWIIFLKAQRKAMYWVIGLVVAFVVAEYRDFKQSASEAEHKSTASPVYSIVEGINTTTEVRIVFINKAASMVPCQDSLTPQLETLKQQGLTLAEPADCVASLPNKYAGVFTDRPLESVTYFSFTNNGSPARALFYGLVYPKDIDFICGSYINTVRSTYPDVKCVIGKY